MKKVFLSIIVIGTLLSACGNNGNKVETNDAENVEINKNKSTKSFKTIEQGSQIVWRASHIGGVQPRFGKLSIKQAEFLVNNHKLNNANIEIDMTSLTVENFDDEESKTKLKGHLQGADFFKVETYPSSKFELTNIEEIKGDYNSKVTGNLTILDTIKSITFKANVLITESNVSIQSEDFAINRTDWGLVYHVEGTEGVPVDYLIANDIGFTINVNMSR